MTHILLRTVASVITAASLVSCTTKPVEEQCWHPGPKAQAVDDNLSFLIHRLEWLQANPVLREDVDPALPYTHLLRRAKDLECWSRKD